MKKIDKSNIENILALTPTQEGILFQYLKNTQSELYHEQLSLEISGNINIKLFEKTWNKIITANEMLRSKFIWEKMQKPFQVILKKFQIKPVYLDLTHINPNRLSIRIKEIKVQDRGQKFDLKEVPFRITLCRIGKEKYVMIVSHHHILYDGWSTGIILKEFLYIYNGLNQNRPVQLPQKNKFENYIKWQQNRKAKEQEKFWKNFFKGYESTSSFSIKTKVSQEISSAEKLTITIGKDQGRLQKFLKKYKISMAAFLYGCWGLLLQRYNNTNDVLFGTTVSGRTSDIENIEEMVGLFINTIPLRVETSTPIKLINIIQNINKILQERAAFDSTSLLRIREYSGLDNLTQENRDIFDTLVVIENYPLDKYIKKRPEPGEISIDSYSIFEMTNYDLTLSIIENNGIEINFIYDNASLTKESINNISIHFANTFEEILENPYKYPYEIAMLSQEEKKQLLIDFNLTEGENPEFSTIIQPFIEQAKRTPDHIALLGSESSIEKDRGINHISYGELDSKSGILGQHLLNRGVGADTVVGIMVERTPETVAGIFAILKSGGAYLPITPDTPSERISHIVGDSGIKMVLSSPETGDQMKEAMEQRGIQLIDNTCFQVQSPKTTPTPQSGIKSRNRNIALWANNFDSMAYIIYTSGSTGKPKGVMVNHDSAVNLLFHLQKCYPFIETDTYLLKTSFIFDVSTAELFGWYWGGGRLALLEQGGERDPQRIILTIRKLGITHINFVPSMFTAFIEALNPQNIENLSSLKYIFLAGEALLPGTVNQFRHLNSEIQLENLYGPTEGTVYSSSYPLKLWQERGAIPIGKPLPHIQLYILDKNNNLQPLEVPGELYISGRGLARGYLNRPELTAEKFTSSHNKNFCGGPGGGFSKKSPLAVGDKFYQTGDLARWWKDGNIEYLGRIDTQVKIRGFRIELGEIENQLLACDQIREAAVIARPGKFNDRNLCAYIVPRIGKLDKINTSVLKEQLANKLPDYMVPTQFIPMPELPLNPSGKLDRKALPQTGLLTHEEYVAPRNIKEKTLVEIWSQILGLESRKIGIDDNFFELGGHSLKAIGMINRIYNAFDIQLSVSKLFDFPTVRKLVIHLEDEEKKGYTPIQLAELKEYYDLSPFQKRFYVFQQLESEDVSYNIPEVLLAEGHLEEEKISIVLEQMITRHESLRTSFHLVDGEPVQKTVEQVQFKIEHYTLDNREEQSTDDIISNFIRPFTLAKAPLLRFGLLKVEDNKHFILFDIHHIVSDGVSIAIFIREFLALYNEEKLPPLHVHYNDYVHWMKKKGRIGVERSEPQVRGHEVLNLPLDFPRPAVLNYEGKTLSFTLLEKEERALIGLAVKENVTLYMVLLAAYNILLAKISGQENIVLGSPIAGRQHPDIEGVIGLFINPLVLQNFPSSQKTYHEFLKEVKKCTLSAYDNQDYQYEMLVEQAMLARKIGRNPLYDVMFVQQNMDMPEIELPGLKVTADLGENKTSKFDITLYYEEFHSLYKIEYSTSLFKEETIKRFIRYFKAIVAQVLENPYQKIDDIDILSLEERKQILYEFNETDVPYPREKTIYQWYAEQVERTPQKTAIIGKESVSNPKGGKIELTFEEFNRRVNRQARTLRKIGVKKGIIVGLMVERSIDMLEALYAVLKAGGTYLPIDPEYPDKRIFSMLEASKAAILLTHKTSMKQKSFSSFQDQGGKVILVEELKIQSQKEKNTDLEPCSGPKDLIYIIFTSGSTGIPKGAGVYHRGFTNLMYWYVTDFRLGIQDSNLLVTSLSFDLTQKNLYSSLLTGGTLCIPHLNYFDPRYLLKEIEENRVTWINCTPSMFYKLVEYEGIGEKRQLATLRYVFLGGEPISMITLIDWLEKDYHKAIIVNTYGPTECTDICASYRITEPRRFLTETIPIGKPVYNVQLFIPDNNLKPVPVGIPGELLISGEGVGIGYVNDKSLTTQKFIHLKPGPGEAERLFYRTGDLVKWWPDGNIEFLGRIDHQVKVRGFRIELSEIESQLLNYPDIKETVVMAREGNQGDKYLCAYIVPDAGKTIRKTPIREYLAAELPDYMIPAYFVILDKMPLNPNGKVDRKALPKPDVTANRDYVPPENDIQRKLAKIWSGILNLDEHTIGIQDNFFRLGGHSLKATTLIAKIHEVFLTEIPISHIFKDPTIKGIAAFIGETEKKLYSQVEPAELKEYYPLSSAQKRFFIIQQMKHLETGYNLPEVMALEGQLDRARLEQTIKRLIQRHESLRTSFHILKGEPVQRIHQKVEFNIEDLNESGADYDQTIKDFIRPFDLSQPHMLRLGLIAQATGENTVVIDMHHIISDGISLEIFINQFMDLYGGKNLPPLKLQYKDYCQWQVSRNRQKFIRQQESYWLGQFAHDIPVIQLPTDRPRPSTNIHEGETLEFRLENKIISGMNHIAQEQGVTRFMVLLSIFNILVSRLSGQEDIVVGTPVAGRRHNDLSRIIGVFINSLSLRNFPAPGKTFLHFLAEVKENTLNAFENQDYPFENLVEKVEVEREINRNPLFDIMLVLQNMEQAQLQLPEITLKEKSFNNRKSKLDITLTVNEDKEGNGLDFSITYKTALFDKETIRCYIRYLKRIAAAVIREPAQQLGRIEILSPEERTQLLEEFNTTKTEFSTLLPIHRLFEKQVKQTPEGNALVDPLSSQLTYKQINEKANQLARILRGQGLRTETIAAIIAQPGEKMIVGILAILKSGAAFLPIDPQQPNERIAYMLADSQASLLLTTEQIQNLKQISYNRTLSLDDPSLYTGNTGNLPSLTEVRDIVYTVYTSGTTGKSKGTLIENKNLVNYIRWFKTKTGINKNHRTIMTSSFGFDLGYTLIYSSLLSGGQLHMVPRETYLSPEHLLEYISSQQITYLKITPSLFTTIVGSHRFSQEEYPNLRLIVLGGEAIKLADIRQAHTLHPHLEIMNHYGPTEATIGCVAQYIDFQDFSSYQKHPTIGIPISNMSAFILDIFLKPVPIKVAGELCISGQGIGRGYLNRPELTREKFCHWHSLQDETNRYSPDDRDIDLVLYRTGDQARWLANGRIEFLGRIDLQVKIRGYRIESGEIESYLILHPAIKEAAVIPIQPESGSQYLCAYIVCKEKRESSSLEQDLRQFLSADLPDYMIPAYFAILEQIPLTPNGKLNRKLLPQPQLSREKTYIAPRNPLEERLTAIWQEVLVKESDISTLIGIDDNFFAMGGNSLSAISLISRIEKESHVRIPLGEIFNAPTIRGQSRVIKNSKISIYRSLEPQEKKDYYPLSSAQKRIFILQQMDENGTGYNMPEAILLEGEVEGTDLETVFTTLIKRHESLRTSFTLLEKEPVQRISDRVDFKIEYYLSTEKYKSDTKETEQLLKKFIRPFQLSRAPLIRIGFVSTADIKHILMIDMHHIISDGISRRLLVKEFMEIMATLPNHRPTSGDNEISQKLLHKSRKPEEPGASRGLYKEGIPGRRWNIDETLPPLKLQYKDFAQWQSDNKQQATLLRQKEYWKRTLGGEIPVLNIPIDFPRPAVQSFAGNQLTFTINPSEAEAMKAMAITQGTTLFMLLLTIYNILLGKLSNQEDILVGTPTAGRGHADLETIIGMFVNTLVLRNHPRSQLTFVQLLQQIKEKAMKAFENQDYQYEELVEELSLVRDASRNPLFDTLFVLQNMETPALSAAQLKLTPIKHQATTAKFDLSLLGQEVNEGIQLTVEYCTALFKAGTIRRYIKYFNRIVSTITKNTDIQLAEIDILSTAERHQLLKEFNNTAREYPKNYTISQLLEHQAEQTPDRIALAGNRDQSSQKRHLAQEPHLSYISYKKLDQLSQKLSGILKENGCNLDTIVAITAERSFEMVIGILSILKAGGAYLPIDQENPEERKRYLVADSNTKIILTTENHIDWKPNRCKIINITPRINENKETATAIRYPPPTPKSLAYIIYTSGSTGKPKGVMVNQYSVIRLVKNTDYITIQPSDKLLQTGALSFDASTFEIWGTLLNGIPLYLIGKDELVNPVHLKSTLEKNNITILWMTAPLFNQMLQEDKSIFKNLRYLLVGGDILSPTHIKLLKEAYPHINIINGYGPTENTTFSTTHPIQLPITGNIPIGKPIANSTAYILDKTGSLVPVGVPGELVVGGDGLARGYLNNPELTAEKFNIQWTTNFFNPLATEKGGKDRATGGKEIKTALLNNQIIYHTGDLARWQKDGTIEFLGRQDFQVKIRGYRIELEEIKDRLLNHESVKDAVVIDRKDKNGEKYLYAYIVPMQKEQPTLLIEKLREHLAQEIPGYMHPAAFVMLEAIPLNPNGKVERKALPEPEWSSGEQFTPPRNEQEKELSQIWAQVLDIDEKSIGIDDNFFQLGGHSLKATILISRINQQLNVKIPLVEIFSSPTIRELTPIIFASYKKQYSHLEQTEEKEYYPLSSAQKRLYLLQQLDREGIGYNITYLLKLEGKLERNQLEEAFKKLIQRHESFRTSFIVIQDRPVQRINREVKFTLETHGIDTEQGKIDRKKDSPPHVDGKASAAIIRKFISYFDLTKAPLLRASLIKTGTKAHILAIDMHHIIADGMSINLLINDLIAYYKGDQLPEIQQHTYKDFSVNQNKQEVKARLSHQQDFWLKEFSDGIPLLEIPLDFKRPEIQSFAGQKVSFQIEKYKKEQLQAIAQKEEATLFMVLLSVYNILLNKLSQQEDIVVGVPIAGRRQAELHQIIGVFVNTLAMRNKPHGEKTFSQFLQEVKTQALESFENQEYPFEDLVEKLEIARDAGRNPLFDTLFVLQNMDNQEIIIPDLKLTPISNPIESSKFDLSLISQEMEDRIQLTLEYCTALFKKETIQRYIEYFNKIVEAVIQSPEIEIAEIDILSPGEKHQLLIGFNDTAREYPKNQTLSQLFRDQAAQVPNRIALVGNSESKAPNARLSHSSDMVYISHQLLDQQSQLLATALKKKGSKPDTIIGIILEHSIEMAIGLVGIIKAGGAYMPIDSDHPEERKRYMLSESNTKLIVSLKKDIHWISDDDEIITINQSPSHTQSTQEKVMEMFSSQYNSSNLSYILYTSGSTGKPKGVMVNQYSVARLVKNPDYITFQPEDKLLQTVALGFDVSTFEVWGTLLNRIPLYLSNKENLINPFGLKTIIRKNKISLLWLTTALFNRMVQEDIEIFKSLRKLMVGGDVLSSFHIRQLKETYPNLDVMNGYGPTENTTFSTTHKIELPISGNISIGKPVANSTVYILDKKDRLVPVGVTGEIIVGGAGVARGYLNRPELTADKFVTLTLLKKDLHQLSNKVYRTGDLGRWESDGTIEFLGRRDFQVKIRGYRIELGEIEDRLLKHPAVKEAFIMVKGGENDDKYICAYMVPGDMEFFTEKRKAETALKQYLTKDLPDYMHPNYYVFLAEMPLTHNKKVNRNALPEPDILGNTQYLPPSNETEERLVSIWSTVLGLNKKIGCNENFFVLGGHSLKAIILIGKIRRQMGIDIPLAQLFTNPTIKLLARYIRNQGKESHITVNPVEKKEYYPLSSAQKRMYVIYRSNRDSTVYNMPTILKLEGAVETNRFFEVFKKLIYRHESLRTTLQTVQEEPVQIVNDRVEFQIENKIDTGEKPRNHEHFIRPFDLSRAPLLRVGLTRLSEQDNYLLLLDMHHSISDGISTGILVKEFISLYTGEKLPLLKLQYKDYSEWQQSRKHEEGLNRQLEYWKKQFHDEVPVLEIPTDNPRPINRRYEGKSLHSTIDSHLLKELKSLALERETTLYQVLLALYNILLNKLCNQEDIVVGTVTTGRRYEELEPVMGMFVNTLVLRNFPHREKTFDAFLEEVKIRSMQAFDHQDYQYEDLIDQLSYDRSNNRNPLFDTMFVVQNIEIPQVSLPGLTLAPVEIPTQKAKFDLLFIGEEKEENLSLTLEYSTQLFKGNTIQRYITYYKKIITAIITNPSIKIADIEIITPEEKKQLLLEFNDTHREYPQEKTIRWLFREQVEKHPQHSAIIGKSLTHSKKLKESVNTDAIHFTYQELDRHSNQLSHLLESKGVKPDTPVGIMIERSPEMVIGVLGIIKAGGAYLPIDPQYPVERRNRMLKDSQASILLIYGQDKVVNPAGQVIRLDKILKDREKKIQTWENKTRWHNLAYIMYTSGSTGIPKGVLVIHRNVVRLIKNTNFVELNSNQRILPTGALEFDASTFEIWGALLNGLTLVLAKKGDILNPARLQETIETYGIETLWLTSPLFNQLVQSEVKIFAGINNLLVGGDALSPIHINRVRKHYPGIKIINGYGPTENTTFTTTFLIDKEYSESIPIGTPIANTDVVIVNISNQLQPIGVTGELCTGGSGIARGYLNDPELTHDRFITTPSSRWTENPSASANESDTTRAKDKAATILSHGYTPVKILYRTGDLARWQPDGNIQFLGRKDHQVKLRGFRVELGEIENRILSYKNIKEAVILVKQDKDGQKYLCAYILPKKQLEPGKEETFKTDIKEYLQKRLPTYMIPSYFIILDEIPLTPNGKIDRKAMPDPELGVSGEIIAPPRNATEKKLAVIWSEVLNVPLQQIGIDADFFNLGGHSLTILKLINSIQKEIQVKLDFQDVFQLPTIAALGQLIENSGKAKQEQIRPQPQKEYYELSYAQKRLWILYQMAPENAAFNLPMRVTLKEPVEEINVRKSLERLIQRHESFRTYFKNFKGSVKQFIQSQIPLEIEAFDLSHLEPEAQIEKREQLYWEESIKPFKLETPPLFRTKLIKCSPNEYDLTLTMHHIITDGWSMEILKNEFIHFYEAIKKDREINLKPLKNRYIDYINWQEQLLAEKENINAAKAFWEKQLRNDPPVLQLHYDIPKNHMTGKESAAYRIVIPEGLLLSIKKIAKENKASLYMVLLAIYNILLYRITDQSDILLAVPAAARQHEDLKNIVGFFVNTLVVRNQVEPNETFIEFLTRVQENTLNVLEYQSYPLELICSEAKIKYPEISVFFNMSIFGETPHTNIEEESSTHIPHVQEAKFDIVSYLVEYKNGIAIETHYYKQLFTPQSIEKMIQMYQVLMEEVSQDPKQYIGQYRYSLKNQKNELKLW